MKRNIMPALRNLTETELNTAIKNKVCVEIEDEEVIYVVPVFGGG